MEYIPNILHGVSTFLLGMRPGMAKWILLQNDEDSSTLHCWLEIKCTSRKVACNNVKEL